MTSTLIQPAMRILQPFSLEAGKMIQVYIDGVPLFCVGDYLRFEHADLLERILTESTIPFETETRMRQTIPLARGQRYKMVGAGMIGFDPTFRTICLNGHSLGYDLRPDRTHAGDFLAAVKMLGPMEYDNIDIK